MTAPKYKHHFHRHPVKEEWFGKYINFEGGQAFHSRMSALYVVIRDDKSNGDTPHTHDFDEYLSFIGLDADNPDYLGGEVDLCLGEEQEKHTINKSTTVYIPKGMKHLPITFKKIDKPFVLAHLFLTDSYTRVE
ncbi:MAG: hypothetical protein A2Y92_04700 [Chloroflexi bacterium RBG_13_57_8]|nr:MAG: hypothetical protein A2Y92_04700 [Chloroflexi bacterium RBG_13_57_8]